MFARFNIFARPPELRNSSTPDSSISPQVEGQSSVFFASPESPRPIRSANRPMKASITASCVFPLAGVTIFSN
jgi:hypothetical protein